MSENINYTESFEELQKMVNEIEQGETSVDELSKKVKRASYLISFCKKKFSTTEKTIEFKKTHVN